jgi:hypothetical protein
MAFIMRGWSSRLSSCLRPIVLWLILPGLLPVPAIAGNGGVEVKAVEFKTTSERQAQLDAQLVFHLSDHARQAVLHGVPLSWRVIVQWRKQRDYWWDGVLLEKNLHLILQYHALLNQFSVLRDKVESEMFSTLEDALREMGWLRLSLGQEERSRILLADSIAIRVVFERDALPPPLQPESWLDKQWDLSADWSLWPIQK